MYKLSRFHYFIKHHPQNILYHTLTGSLMWANNSFAEGYFELCKKKTITDKLLICLFNNEKIIDKLKKEGIIIKKDIDELKLIKKCQEIRNKDTSSHFEFIVTYACNLKCIYCYSISEDVYMSPDIASEAANFAIKTAKKRKSKDMMIQFYGGEPLLNLNAIEIIVEKMRRFKTASGIVMGTQLTTNGVLINKEVIDLIKSLGPIQVQITLDGTEKIHNARRPLTGRNCYQLILNNIKNLIQHIDELIIRINVDHGNEDYCIDLVNELASNDLLKVSLTVIPTFSHTDSCSHYESHCLTSKEFVPLNYKIWHTALDLGFNISWSPLPTFMSCSTILPATFGIDPYGDLYKCAAVYGNKKYSVGNIYDGIDDSPNSLYSSYISRDPLKFENKKCLQCPSLPICAGGCAYRAERYNGTMFSPDCPFDKKQGLGDFIRLYSDWYRKGGFKFMPKVIV